MGILQWIELDFGRTKQVARKSGIDHVAQIHVTDLGGIEQGRVIGQVALDMPGARNGPRGLGGGAEVNIDHADPERGCAVKLASGLNRKIGIEHDFAPWPRTAGWRRKSERVQREIGKDKIVE